MSGTRWGSNFCSCSFRSKLMGEKPHGHFRSLTSPVTSRNDQKSLNLVSSAFSFYGQHTRLRPVTLAQSGIAWHGVILSGNQEAFVWHILHRAQSGGAVGALTEFKPISRAARIRLLSYNESDRKALERTAHGTELRWKNVELKMSKKDKILHL